MSSQFAGGTAIDMTEGHQLARQVFWQSGYQDRHQDRRGSNPPVSNDWRSMRRYSSTPSEGYHNRHAPRRPSVPTTTNSTMTTSLTGSLEHQQKPPKPHRVREPRRRPRRPSKDQNMPDDTSIERSSKMVSPPPATPDFVDTIKTPTTTRSTALSRSMSSEPCLTDMERRKNRLNGGGCGEYKYRRERHKTPSVEAIHRRQHSTGDCSKPERSESVLRYDRDFLLALQKAPDSQHKPPGLPLMPEIILDKPHSVSGKDQVSASKAGLLSLPLIPSQPPSPSRHSALPSPSSHVISHNSTCGRHHSSASRAEQTAAHGRKVITISLQQAVQLHTVDNAWKPASIKQTPTESYDDAEQLLTEDMYRKLRGILNKLTPQKFQTLILQVNELQIDTEERLKGCIDIVFEKAISEPSYSVAYANLAKCLVNLKVPMESNPLEMVTFRKLLLNRCQHEFETDQKEEGDIARMQVEIDNATSDEVRRQLIEEKELAEYKARRRSLGNIRFIGELFKLKMLTEGIMHDCLHRLLRARDEDSLECLCGLLRTIGADIDNTKSKSQVDSYFQKIDNIITKQKISTRLKFMLQDIVELRNTSWVPRRDDNKPKTIQQIHNEAAAEEEQKSAMLRVASSPAIADRHGRQPRCSAPSTPTFVPPSPRLRIGRLPVDESVQLGPHGRSAWQSGSTGGSRRTPSVEGDRQPRFQLSASKGDEDRISHTRSTSGAREMALHTIEKDRSAAIAAVRNISGGVNPTTTRGHVSPPTVAGPSTGRESRLEAVEHLVRKLTAAEIEKKSLSILEEYLDLADIQEAVACFRELDCVEFMDQFVSQVANHVIDKTSSARQLTGTLLFQLIATKLMSVDQLVDGLKELFSMAEDIEIDVPKIWQYLAELISPLIQPGHCLPLNFLYRASESVRHSRKVNELIVSVLHDAAKRSGRPAITDMWHTAGLNWSMFVPAADVNAFLNTNNLLWIETPSTCAHDAENDPMSHMYKLIVDPAFDVDAVRAWITENTDPVFQLSIPFIRTVTTAICSTAVIGADKSRYTVNKDEVKKRAGLLSTFIGDDSDRQLQAIYAVQAYVHHLQHPPDVLRNLFDVFYDEDIILEESFNRWRMTNEPAEHGKGVAVASVVQFFRWLDEAGS